MTDAESASLRAALTRLDADIAATERHLAELRAMRDSIQPFIERYVGEATLSVEANASGSGEVTTLTDQVVTVFDDRPDEILDVDDVMAHLEYLFGTNAKRDAVRNAIHYAVRMGRIHKERRGRFTLKDTSTPGATGVDVNEEPELEGSSWEGGGGRLGSALLHDQGDGPHQAPFDLGRVGDRAPIGG